MSALSSRAAVWIVPIWLIVIGLIGLLGAPVTSATSVLLIIAGLVAPAITLSLWHHLSHSPKSDMMQATSRRGRREETDATPDSRGPRRRIAQAA
jgi:hypothetical protein